MERDLSHQQMGVLDMEPQLDQAEQKGSEASSARFSEYVSLGPAVVFMHIAVALALAGLFGILANSMQLPILQSLYVAVAYFAAYTCARFVVRSKRLVLAMLSRPVLVEVSLLVASLVSAACGCCALVCEVTFPALGTGLLCAMGLVMGAHASLLYGLWAELASPKGRVSGTGWHVIPVCVGILVALIIMFLQEEVREWVFVALCPLSSLAWILSGARTKCGQEKTILNAWNTSYALAVKTHVYWVALLFVFGFAYATGIRYWTIEYGAAALLVSLAIGACFPLIRAKLGGGGLGQTSRVYLPLCILTSFLVATMMPQVLPVAMVIAIIFVFYQGLSNATFLVGYARAFNESVMYKLSEGRFPPLIGLLGGICVSLLVEQFEASLSPVVWTVIPCLGCMLAVFTYTLQIFNQGNPVNEGVVRNLDDGIESPWLGDDAQEMEAFKQRCQKFAQEKQLTPRETEVFFLLACGYNTVSIAEVLMVSPSTVKTHFYRIYTKVDMHSQQEIIMNMRSS